MNVYSIAAKRAIPKTFAICFPCFSKLTRLSRPDSNVFAGEEELLLKHVMNLFYLSNFKYNLKQSKQTVMNINFEKGGNVIQNMKPNFHYY